jgi:hypothetical protein
MSESLLESKFGSNLQRQNTWMESQSHITPDGRVTLRGSVLGNNKSRFVQDWLSDPSTYPIIAVMCGAMSLIAFFGGRALLFEPDAQ